MLSDFFQLDPVPANEMLGVYDLRLVLLSYLVATFASYIALDITGRIRDTNNTRLGGLMWLCGGAFAMGAGIWSMHFIGMLAFTMPGMAMGYDPFWTGLSMIVAILASSIAFIILRKQVIKIKHFLIGGVVLGIAIASMHYVGMEAMKIITDIHYLPGLFSLSIVIAILASEAALWLALKSNQVVVNLRFRLKIVSAFIMGAAICGMHYTGMAAAVFTPMHTVMPSVSSLEPQILSISVAGVTFIILGIAVIVSTYKEAQNQLLLSKARQAGIAEVAASVLHNVGNVLNSVNVSAASISEKISQSKLENLGNLSALLHDHKHDLAAFLTQDRNGIEISNYVQVLYEHWKDEQKLLVHETETLIKNIEHIKDIISVQQNLSKASKLEQITAIDGALNEALFITGIEINHPEIKIEKKFGSLKPFMVDKVKLMQILINLIRNAKDAVTQSDQKDKKITLVISTNSTNKVLVKVIDNGVGIASGNITRIFSYGFTTKKEGHGFGLHSSALAAKEMGGTLNVSSDGLGKGCTFVLELPYNLPAA